MYKPPQSGNGVSFCLLNPDMILAYVQVLGLAHMHPWTSHRDNLIRPQVALICSFTNHHRAIAMTERSNVLVLIHLQAI